jgi:type I restriction enzyme S subunit
MEVREPSAKYLAKAAYKQTEVGVIPEDWEVAPLEAFTSFISYGFTNPMPTSDGGIYMITARDINRGRILFDTARCTTEEAYRTLLTAKSRPRNGDLLLTKDGTLGRLAVVSDVLVCINQSVAILRPNPKASPAFLKALLESPVYQSKMLDDAGGSTIKHIYITIVNRMPVGVPPTLAEQHAIAEALSDADALIEALEQLLAKKRQIKQGAMQELLTGQKRLPGFAGEWETRPFDGVLQRINAKAHQIQASDYQPIGGYPVVDQGKERVVAFSDQHEKRFKCPEQGVIVFGDHTCIVKYVDYDFLVGADGTQVLVAKERQNARFHAFQLEYDGIQPTGYNRHFSLLKEREFLVPALAEQTAIATLLSDMDAEIAALEAKLGKARGVKQGMMQELLTGRIRLV